MEKAGGPMTFPPVDRYACKKALPASRQVVSWCARAFLTDLPYILGPLNQHPLFLQSSL